MNWHLGALLSTVFGLISFTNCNPFYANDNQHPFVAAFGKLKGNGLWFADLITDVGITADDDSLNKVYDFAEILDEESNTSVCAVCRGGISALKAIVAASDSWEDLRQPLIDACYSLIANVTDEYVNTDVLCPGTIDAQLPHIYEVLRPVYGKSPEEVCRHLNLCLNPRENTSGSVKRIHPTPKKENIKSLEERKANALKIAQLADVHVEPRYVEDTSTDCGLPVCCVPAYGPGDASAYGDYQCNVPERTLELFFHKTAEFDPAFVVFSGDTPPHAFWNESYDFQLECTSRLIESATRILANYSVYPNIGNHEMYPTNMFSVEFLEYTQGMLDEFAEWWTDLAGFGEEQQETMRAAGYYSIPVLPGLRLLSFNTNYWYIFNWYNVLNDGEPEMEDMKQFMNDTLWNARENNEKVIIVGHHPMTGPYCISHQSVQFEALVLEYSDIILFQLAGHTHYDHYRVLPDATGTAVAATFVNPTSGTNSYKNPSMRLLYIDPDTYELIDYEQYGYDMLEVIESGEEPNIELIYSAVTEYGLPDMSPASWHQLSQRMETDDELFQRYNEHYYTRYVNASVCEDALCRTSRLCDTKYYSFDLYLQCVQELELYTLF